MRHWFLWKRWEPSKNCSSGPLKASFGTVCDTCYFCSVCFTQAGNQRCTTGQCPAHRNFQKYLWLLTTTTSRNHFPHRNYQLVAPLVSVHVHHVQIGTICVELMSNFNKLLKFRLQQAAKLSLRQKFNCFLTTQ